MSYFKKSHPHKPQTAYDRKKEKDEIEAELELKEQEEDEEFLEEMYPELTLPHFWELSYDEIVQHGINPNGEDWYERTTDLGSTDSTETE